MLSPLVEQHIGAVVAVATPEQLLQHVLVHELDVVVVELYPSVLDLNDRNVVAVLVALPDMHHDPVQAVQVGLALVVVVLG